MAAYAYRSKSGLQETQFIGLRRAIDGALVMIRINAIVRIIESTEYSYQGLADDEPAIAKSVINVLFTDGKRGTYNGEIADVAGALGIQLSD